MPFALARTGMATALHRAVPGALHLASAAPGHGLRHMPVARLALEHIDSALIGFRGLMLHAWSEKHNAFLRPLKQKGFKEERVTTIALYDIGTSHDPGIQQAPRTKMPATLAALAPCCVARHGITARRAGPVLQSHPRIGVSSPTRCHTTPPPGRSRPPWPASPASRRSTSADC
jgi:hypothetical protein